MTISRSATWPEPHPRLSKANTGITGPKVSSWRNRLVVAAERSRWAGRSVPPQCVARAAGQDLAARRLTVRRTWSSTLAMALSSIRAPTLTPSSKGAPTFRDLGDLARRACSTIGLGDRRLVDIDAVGTDAGLARVAELALDGLGDGQVQVGVVEHDQRRGAAQLHRHPLQGRRALLGQLAGRRASSR